MGNVLLTFTILHTLLLLDNERQQMTTLNHGDVKHI